MERRASLLAVVLLAVTAAGECRTPKTEAPVDADGATPLHWAVYEQDAKRVAQLIRSGADVNAMNQFGATPMSVAAENGDAEIIRLLLKAGVSANAPNREGQTPLMGVARTGRIDAAKLLLDARADPNARENWGGQTALMWAASQSQPAMVKLLIARGADPNARGAVRDWQRRMTAEPRVKGMHRGGLTPLLYAARQGCLPCVQELLAGGAQIDLPAPDRESPLIVALMNLHFDVAYALIEAGAGVDRWDLYGRTPLYVAIDMHILPKGGRPDLPSVDDRNAIDVMNLLLARGANPNIQLKLRPPIRDIVQDYKAGLGTGVSPLLRAAQGGDVEAVKLLLSKGARVDLPDAGKVTPVIAVAGALDSPNVPTGRDKTQEEVNAILQLLLEAGADVNARDQRQQTALHFAARAGWTGVVKLLVARGADVSVKDAQGRTALALAMGDYPAGRNGKPPVYEETAAVLRASMAAKPAAGG